MTGYLPVSSANCDVTKPTEPVTAFGHLGALALSQTNLTTCKSSLKIYLSSGAQNPDAAYTGIGITGLTNNVCPGLLQALTGDAVKGNYTVLSVTPNGFTMSGILTNIGIDISMGGFGTCNLGFAGIGEPAFLPISQNAVTEQPNMPTSLIPVTTVGVSGAITSGCANSFKFSLDMGTDILACLGDPVDMIQSSTMNSLIATKPPYKATISVEGYGIDIDYQNTGIPPANSKYYLGGLGIALPKGQITAKSFNNAAGQASASFSYSAEDTTANFSN